MPSSRSVLTCFALSLVAAAASAQPAPAPKPAPDPKPAAPAPPAAEPPAEAPLEPKLPEIDDPMLKPVAAAKNMLRSWQEAVRLARSQSSELAVAGAQIDLAVGQERSALARALPTLTGTGGVTRHLLFGEGVTEFSTTGVKTGKIPDPSTTWNAGLALRVPVFAPQAWYDHGTAKRGKGAVVDAGFAAGAFGALVADLRCRGGERCGFALPDHAGADTSGSAAACAAVGARASLAAVAPSVRALASETAELLPLLPCDAGAAFACVGGDQLRRVERHGRVQRKHRDARATR